MNKSDLIDLLSKETSPLLTKSKQVVELFFDETSKTVASGGRVEIRGP